MFFVPQGLILKPVFFFERNQSGPHVRRLARNFASSLQHQEGYDRAVFWASNIMQPAYLGYPYKEKLTTYHKIPERNLHTPTLAL